MKKLLVTSLALLSGLGICSTAFAGIAGSKHDFSAIPAYGVGGVATGDLCVPCHAPHNNQNLATELLWNHETTAVASYTLYSNAGSYDGEITSTQPTPVSKFCLSCHDGTVAPDSYTGHAGTVTIAADANLGTTFGNDHPFSFVYDAALVTADTASAGGMPGLYAPATVIAAGLPLFDGLMECATCHDVHNKHGNTAGLLNVANTGSALCLSCHIK